MRTLDYARKFLPRESMHTVKLMCRNCKHVFNDYEYTEKEDLQVFRIGATEQFTMLLKCPKCDKNWRKTAGVCWKAFPHMKRAIMTALNKRC